ncbi:hypothetical protein [Streptomyces bobili]|uniref:hypothetical protein n=1 Tax=Streptomyces bobili TaxID=67280 RepID=UPI00117F76EB|nr:hypothetical protein [Streptomyces bobili]
MTDLRMTGLLTVDCGAGREDRDTGAVRYWTPPRARYDCLLCGGREGPVTGSVRVREFVEHHRRDHRARCGHAKTT